MSAKTQDGSPTRSSRSRSGAGSVRRSASPSRPRIIFELDGEDALVWCEWKKGRCEFLTFGRLLAAIAAGDVASLVSAAVARCGEANGDLDVAGAICAIIEAGTRREQVAAVSARQMLMPEYEALRNLSRPSAGEGNE